MLRVVFLQRIRTLSLVANFPAQNSRDKGVACRNVALLPSLLAALMVVASSAGGLTVAPVNDEVRTKRPPNWGAGLGQSFGDRVKESSKRADEGPKLSRD